MQSTYLASIKNVFETYKKLADNSLATVPEEKMHWQYNTESNSMAIIIKHMSGNMISRWTDFMTTDGEKPWRNRDEEFDEKAETKVALLLEWNKGWSVLFQSLNSLNEDNLQQTVYIRNEAHTVLEAINRQIAHYSYHVGQMVYLAKMLSANWQSLSIPKGGSQHFNQQKFSEIK